MAIRHDDGNDGIRRIYLSGRLDTVGSEEIASEFAALSESAKHGVLVNLSEVTFLSSMGIRAIIAGAKALQAKGGRMVLHASGNDVVLRTIEVTGVDELIPMFEDEDDAERALLGPG